MAPPTMTWAAWQFTAISGYSVQEDKHLLLLASRSTVQPLHPKYALDHAEMPTIV